MFYQPMMSPEEQDRYRAEQDRQQMRLEDGLHRAYGLLMRLDQEGLEAAKLIFTSLANAGEGSAKQATFFDAIVETLLAERHGTCLACDKNHNDLTQLVGESGE